MKTHNIITKEYKRIINETNKNIVLVGMPLCGKSSIGKCLAHTLHKKFYDTDKFIEAFTCMSIQKIFSNKGEHYFRKLENYALKNISNKHNMIISTGGGILTYKNNIDVIRNLGCIIYLFCNTKLLIKRFNSCEHSNRPLLKNNQSIKQMFAQRHSTFIHVSDFVINCHTHSMNEIINKLFFLVC